MKFLAVFVLSLTYAIFRYLVFGNVVIANLPCYVVNKAAALSSILALSVAAYCARGGRANDHLSWFAGFKALLFLHVMLSTFLFSSDYYPKMFSGGKMNLFGELFMLSGVVAVFLLFHRTIIRETTVQIKTLQILSLVAIAFHNFFLGIGGWWKWQEWPGYLPPISMISFILSLVAMAFQITTPARKTAQN